MILVPAALVVGLLAVMGGKKRKPEDEGAPSEADDLDDLSDFEAGPAPMVAPGVMAPAVAPPSRAAPQPGPKPPQAREPKPKPAPADVPPDVVVPDEETATIETVRELSKKTPKVKLPELDTTQAATDVSKTPKKKAPPSPRPSPRPSPPSPPPPPPAPPLEDMDKAAEQAGAKAEAPPPEPKKVKAPAEKPVPPDPTPPEPTSKVPSETLDVVQAMLAEESKANWKRPSDALVIWQKSRRLKPDGLFGPKTALQFAKEIGTIPIVRYWPRGSYPSGKWLEEFRASLRALAAKAPEPRASKLLASAKREQGQGWGSNQTAIKNLASIDS